MPVLLFDLDNTLYPQSLGVVALERLGASADRCSLIDDLRTNLAAAKRLGMRTIWVAESDGEARDETVDHVIVNVREVERILVGASNTGV